LFIQGEDGKDGEAGQPGENGKPGRGIESIKLEDGKLKVEYTDGTTEDISLPEQITHIHKYSSEIKDVTVIIPFTETTDGIGYKVCTENGCDHVEVVVIKRNYTVNVTSEGQPVANAKVTINGVSTTTNADGVAQVSGFGAFNDYLISVEKAGYTPTKINRTGEGFGSEVEIEINKAFDVAVERDEYGEYTYYDFNGAGTYTLPIATQSGGGIDTVYIRIKNETSEAKKYVVSTNDSCFEYLMDETTYDYYIEQGDKSGAIVVKPGKTVVALLNVSMMGVFQKVQAGEMAWGDDYYLTLSFEEAEAPDMGTAEMPYDATVDTEISLPEGDDWVYYTWYNESYKVSKVQIDLTNADMEVTFYNSVCEWVGEGDWTWPEYTLTENATPTAITSGETYTLVTGELDGAGVNKQTFKIRIKKKAGATNASFKLTTLIPYGQFEKPATATLGQKTTIDCSEDSWAAGKWAVLNVETEGDYTFIQGKSTVIKIFDDVSAGEDESEPILEIDSESPKGVVHLKAGVYYVSATAKEMDGGTFECEFTVRAASLAEDAGISAGFAKPVTGSFETIEASAGSNTYYKYTASGAGVLNVSVPSGCYAYVSNPNSTTMTRGAEVECADGDVIIIRVVGNVEQFNVTVTYGSAEVAHTFTVKDNTGAALGGLTVNVMNGTTQVATGTTDASGNVTLSFVRGSYTVQLEGYNAETYYYENVVQTRRNSTAYNLTLRKDKSSYKFVVQSGATKFENATVTLKAGSLEVTGQTNANGEVTLTTYFPTLSSSIKYSVELADADKAAYALPAGTYEISAASTSETAEVTVDFVATEEYTVSLVDENGAPVRGVTVSLSAKEAGGGSASNTTDMNGVVKFKMAPGEYTASFSGYSAGYRIANVTVSHDSPAATATLVLGDSSAAGATSINAVGSGNALSLGDNVIANSAAVGYYSFGASSSGRYTFTVNDAAAKGFITYFATRAYYGGSTVYINNGKEINISGNLVLNEARTYNKAYSFSINLAAGQSFIIGYDTGVEAAAGATISVSVADPAVALVQGSNTLTVTNGTANCEYVCTGSGDLTITWTGDATVTINDQAYTSGTTLDVYEDDVLQIVVSSSSASVELELDFQEFSGYPGGYYPGY
ncbi:MAG: hypothetical protein K2O67_00880, partial [Clostridia bacterium]|nr:hypothetical protein [Clostridia bacterium]